MGINLNNFTKSDEIKIKILQVLSDFQTHTPSEIASIIKSNGRSVLKNCYFLQFLGLVNIEKKTTKRTLYYISLNRKLNEKDIEKGLKDIKNLNLTN